MIVRGRLTALPNDTPVPNGTEGEIRLEADDSLVDTVTTADGWYEYEQDGNPGPFYIEWDYGGITHRAHSKTTGPSAATDVGNLPLQFRALSNGIIDGAGGELLLTAAGGSMNVTVADGAALVQGILYDRLTSGTLAVSAAHATLGRLDYVVVEVVPRGAGEDIEGRSVLKLVNGTASGSPALPALTQTSALYQYPVGYVTVGAAVTTIASDKVTPTQFYVGAVPQLLSVTSAHLAANSVTAFAIAADAVGSSELAADAVGASELADNSVASANIIDATITGSDIAASTITSANILNQTITGSDIASGTIAIGHLMAGTVVVEIYEGASGTTFTGYANRLDFRDDGGLSADDVGGAYRKTIYIRAGGVTETMLATAVQTKLNAAGYTGVDTLMPGTGYVATGSLSSGTRTLSTLAVGPLEDGVTYAIQVQNFCTMRGTGTTGTANLRANIDGGAQVTREYQHVGGVPRGTQVTQSAQVVGTGASINVTGSIEYLTGDPVDVRAGELVVVAVPT